MSASVYAEPWDYVLNDPVQAAKQLLEMLRTMEARGLLLLNREGQRELIVTLAALLEQVEPPVRDQGGGE